MQFGVKFFYFRCIFLSLDSNSEAIFRVEFEDDIFSSRVAWDKG